MRLRTYLWCCFWVCLGFAIAFRAALGAGVNGIELGAKPTAAQLQAGLGISVLGGSESASQLAAELSGHYSPPKRSPGGGLPIAPGAHTGFMSLGGMSVQTWVLIEDDGSVSMITVSFDPQAYFERMEAMLREKYGKPVSEGRLDQQTAAGIRVTNIELDWDLPDHSTVSLLKYASEITHGQLKIESELHKQRWSGLYSHPLVPR
jgi:hypothetical protein